MAKKNYDFGEKKVEKVNGEELKVWQSPQYVASKEAAITLLESDLGKNLSEKDFWILKNKTKNGGMNYTSLLITHEGLIKVEALLSDDNKFDQKYCSDPIPFEYAGKKGLYMTYRDERDGMFEIGEITTESCKNGYPFAMLLKRTYDRVVKRKANLFGLYSDPEGFSGSAEEMEEKNPSPKASEPKPRVATTHIPREEDEIVVSDPETGEVISLPANEPKEMPESIPETWSSEEVNPAPAAGNDVNLALEHILEGLTSREGQGYAIKLLMNSEKMTDEQKMQRILLFRQNGTPNDIKACNVILKALEDGVLDFQNSKF